MHPRKTPGTSHNANTESSGACKAAQTVSPNPPKILDADFIKDNRNHHCQMSSLPRKNAVGWIEAAIPTQSLVVHKMFLANENAVSRPLWKTVPAIQGV